MSQDLVQGFRLSPQQKYLWSLQQDSSAYRAQSVIALEGKLNRAALEAALERIVARQEILRTSFEFLPGMKTPVQVVSEETNLDFRTLELGEPQQESLAEILREEAQHRTERFCLVA